MNTDVLVVGGGAAGVAAATAAARAGARVVLLERYGFLGGMATASQVGTVCGLFVRDRERPHPALTALGFVAEFYKRLREVGACDRLRLDAGLWVVPFASGGFARVAEDYATETDAITPVLHATVAEVRTEGPRVVEVQALAWNEPLVVRPTSVVDSSGEASVAALAGAAVEDGARDQASALIFCLGNVDPTLAERGMLEVRRELRRAVEQGRLPAACERLSLIPGTGKDGQLSLKLNLPPVCPGLATWQQVSQAELKARALVYKLHRFLADNTTSCRGARLESVAPQLGFRSGRRIRGRARLTDQDVLGARKTPLGVARGCWPMERWGDSLRPEMTYFEEREYYEIPLDCLRPIELDNVFAAGRCFSAEAGAMSSARVIGTALGTGWAAGTLAAFQALGRPIDEAVDLIRKQMNQ